MPSDSGKQILSIALMLFALFLGVDNVLLPTAMAHAAGSNVWWAIAGFCLTRVGLPLIAVLAVVYSGLPGLREIAGRVHPWFGVFVSSTCILVMGPLAGVPVTAAFSLQIAVAPLTDPLGAGTLTPVLTAVFVGLSGWLAANPRNLVERIGKLFAPLLAATLGLFVVAGFFAPMGQPQAPAVPFGTPGGAVLQGLLDGVDGPDVLAALLFSTLTVGVVREAGFTRQGQIAGLVTKSVLLAAALLIATFVLLGGIGARCGFPNVPPFTSEAQKNGDPVLLLSAGELFGSGGAFLTAAIVLPACLTTAVGLISCTASYLQGLSGSRIPYRTATAIATIVSALVGLFGWETFTGPIRAVFCFILPLCSALVVLSLLHKFVGRRRCVWAWTIGLTGVMALHYAASNVLDLKEIDAVLSLWIPLHDVGLSWIPFAVAGFAIGMIQKSLTQGPAQP